MYLYGNTKIPSLNDKFLYHFTSAETLMKILEGMTLKFSSLANLNDLNEKKGNFIIQDWRKGLKIKPYIVEYCHLISFTQNFQTDESYCECGCNHPRMWAQYADNNKGACIVINEDKFIDINKEILSKIFWKIENVTYKHFIKNTQTDFDDPKSFLESNYKKLFFEKHNDWRQEDERRLFCIGGSEFLSINNCIEFICLGNKFESKNYNELSDILISGMEKNCIKLIPHDFTLQVNADGRCLAMDNAYKIIETVKHKGNRANEYLNYLNKNGYEIQLVD